MPISNTLSHGPAAQGAERLLRNVEVQALVKQLTDKATAKLGITQEYVLGAIVERLEVARKGDDPYAVYKGAELLGRHLKLFYQQARTLRARRVGRGDPQSQDEGNPT